MKYLEEHFKIHQTFLYTMLSSMDRQRKGRTFLFESHNFGSRLQMRYTSTHALRNF
jgi:hypothetical protein